MLVARSYNTRTHRAKGTKTEVVKLWWGQSKRDAGKPIKIGGTLWNKKVTRSGSPT